MQQQEGLLDPFTTEIIRSGVIATTDEMKTNLMRTAYNPIVYEAMDFTVALTDAEGCLVSIGLGLPGFIRGISDTVRAFVRFFGSDIDPDDILLTNDSFTHGSHLNHMIAALPVFHRGEIVAFTCSEPSWRDIGGILGGKPTDIFMEGLQMPYVKIYRKGVLNKELLSIIEANVRNPHVAMGDFRAQIAAVKTGEKRVLHLLNKYGKKSYLSAIGTIFAQSEELARREVERIPEGTYEAESFLDDDGIDYGVHIPIRVKVIVKGDSMTVDLSNMGKQVRGYYNSAAGTSGVQMAFKSITSPTLQPINDGSFRPLKIVLPLGTVVSATKPSAMKCWMTAPMTLADTMWKALATAIPDRICAGHFADLCSQHPNLIDPATKRPTLSRMNVGGTVAGGFGAKHNEDGMPATICLNDGDTHNHPVESIEAHSRYALLLRRGLRQDSGGPGKYRGGLGMIVETVYLWDASHNSHMERSLCPPWGALGGKPGKANALTIKIPTEKLDSEASYQTKQVLALPCRVENYPGEEHPNTKLASKFIPSGSTVVVMTGGGGGFGNPLEREPERVLSDYLDGYISLESAEKEYGVVIIDAGLDYKQTRSLREKLAGVRA